MSSRRSVVLVAAAALAISGCESPPTKEQVGTVGGAVLGGVVGSTIGGGTGRTVAIVVGTIAGGMIGFNQPYVEITPGARRMLPDAQWEWLVGTVRGGGYDHLVLGSSLPWLMPFAAHHLDITLLNRLGFLEVRLRRSSEPMKLELPQTVVVQWNVSPADPILKQLGIKYVAFDKPLDPYWSSFVVPLSSGPIDGFWLYQLR